MVGWPLTLPALIALRVHHNYLPIVIYGLMLLLSATNAIKAIRAGLKHQEKTRESSKFVPYDNRSLSIWIPALCTLAITSGVCLACAIAPESLIGVSGDKQGLLTNPALIFFAVIAFLPFGVIATLTRLDYFKLPSATLWYRKLPDKIKKLVRHAMTKPNFPSEHWRYLSGLSQVIRSAALYELTFRDVANRSKLVIGLAIFVWRFSPIFYTFLAMLLAPIFAGITDNKLCAIAYMLAITNWSALSSSYFTYFSHSDLSKIEQRQGLAKRHILSLCNAINLHPERILDPYVISMLSPKSESMALFLFTVMIPFYLTYISAMQ